MTHRSTVSFGKRQEPIAVAELLRRGFDVYMTLVDDQQIDCALAAERAEAGAEQPSRGATACQATSGLEREIDGMVYALYPPVPRLRRAGALTPEEIKIVEAGATGHYNANRQ